MSLLPFGGLPVREGLELARRAVAALETQAKLMADPEPEEEIVPEEGSVVIGEGPGKYYKESVVETIMQSSYKKGAREVAQELENILDAGWSMPIRQGELRKLVEKYVPKQMKDKK